MLSSVDLVWGALLLIVMAGMWWLAYRMEPHWASKDGKRFLASAQELAGTATAGRPKETRVLVMPDGMLLVSHKRRMRRVHTQWKLVGKVPAPPRRLEIYLAELREDGRAVPRMLTLRIPKKSRVVPVLDALLSGTNLTLSQPDPGSAAPADQPDPG